jgi:hypothetical protein
MLPIRTCVYKLCQEACNTAAQHARKCCQLAYACCNELHMLQLLVRFSASSQIDDVALSSIAIILACSSRQAECPVCSCFFITCYAQNTSCTGVLHTLACAPLMTIESEALDIFCSKCVTKKLHVAQGSPLCARALRTRA